MYNYHGVICITYNGERHVEIFYYMSVAVGREGTAFQTVLKFAFHVVIVSGQILHDMSIFNIFIPCLSQVLTVILGKNSFITTFWSLIISSVCIKAFSSCEMSYVDKVILFLF